MQVVSPHVIQKLKENSKARYRLCYEFNVHMNTVNRWIEENSETLRTAQAVSAIAEELDIDKSEVLIEQDKVA